MSRDWDKAYQDEDTPWDKGMAAPPLVEYLSRQALLGRVLVPGCGTGHDVRALARQGAEVLGMDIAPSAIKKAQTFPLAGRERYVIDDFVNLAEEQLGVYDWVVEHTCLCALDPVERAAYAYSVQKALKPGGQYLAVFFREVSDYKGDGPPHPISRIESDALFLDAFELMESFIPQETYPSRPIGAEELCRWRLRVK